MPVAEQIRGTLAESVHYGSVAATGEDGRLIFSAGDPEALVYPRSALKPLQAVAMVQAGLDLPARLLALAAASHSGARMHREGAIRILSLHGLDERALENIPDLPYGNAERENWLRAGHGPTQVAQNCSGKHAAMVATCAINGWSVAGYTDPGHPLQRHVRKVVGELTEEQIEHKSIDGCGTPLYALALSSMARAFSKIAIARRGTAEHAVADAIRHHPEYVAGEGRDITTLIRQVPGAIAKDGAEGIQLLGFDDGRAVAIKIADGSDRARLPVTVASLARLGIKSSSLEQLAETPVYGGGKIVGSLRAIIVHQEALVTAHG